MVTPNSINFIFWRSGETEQFSHFAQLSSPKFEMLSACVGLLLANTIAVIHPFVVTLRAAIVLIAGPALALGLAEVLTKHINSGISRLLDGVIVTLKLFLGAAVGVVTNSHS